MNIAIILLNWNGKSDTANCLETLKNMNRYDHDVHVTVVDNGSTDDSIAFIRKTYPWVALLTTGKNLGFAGGNNVGMRHAYEKKADYIWLLNNDTLVDKNALQILKGFTERVGISGSKIYFAPGREYHQARYKDSQRGKVFWYAGGIIDWANMYASHRGVDEVDQGQYETLEETAYVSGCSFMMSRKLIETIGFFDERYFMYLEDLDYCLRAKRAGFELRYVPASIIWHVNAGSSGGSGSNFHLYYQTRNRILVGMKYAPMRTKMALLRESVGFLAAHNAQKKKAVMDALMGKWGNRYEQN